MATYELIVYGCQMNDYDGERLAAVMEAAGYEPAAEGGTPDVTLVYTCAVRESATRRALGRITSLARRKAENAAAVIGVGGCWPAVQGEFIKEQCPHVDFVFGTDAFEVVPALIAAARREVGTAVAAAGITPKRQRWPRANVSIMSGCNNFCAYCVVPYARGRERCRPVAEILREVDDLVARGFRDITLIGQNVNSYRDGPVGFAELLAKVDERCEGVFLRFTTNHPRDFGEDVIAAFAAARNCARHVHLPLQSGSDKILKAMNRQYDFARFYEIVTALRRAVPGVCLTTDILVGFPGETEEDFLATLAAVEKVRFDSAYTFMYSVRPGTAAAALPDDVPRREKVRRLEVVAARQREIAAEINERLVGKETVVLVEGRSAKDPHEHAGRMSENKVVNFRGPYEVGDWARVRITRASAWTLRGAPAAGDASPVFSPSGEERV